MATITSAAAEGLQEARRGYFGTTVNPCSFAQWLCEISRVIEQGRRRWLCGHHNLHSLYLLQRSHDVRRYYERCDDCYVDGAPVRHLLHVFGVSATPMQRFSLMDHFLELLEHAEHRAWSVFYLGSREAVVVAGRELIAKRFPRLRIQMQHGYCADSAESLRAINAFKPDVLLVGMGMPLQEQWILQHLDQLDVGFVTQAGATLDYYTGAQAKPPLWLSRMGLAWAYRLAHDPARLWRRYLVEPWGLMPATLRQWRRFRRLKRASSE